jgi:hypothetical protein
VTDLCIRFAGEDQAAQLEQFIAEVLPAFRARVEPGTVTNAITNGV